MKRPKASVEAWESPGSGTVGNLHLLTFDVEDWYHINYPVIDFEPFNQREGHQALLDRMKILLNRCRVLKIRGTFFVLGRLLEKRPELGSWIVEQGHELALHGYDHHLLAQRGPEGFKADLERSLAAYRRITGTDPLGFRAPSWSVDLKTTWVLEILESFGFRYDASVFPIKNFLYGIPTAPVDPFYPVLGGRRIDLLEIPVSVLTWAGRRIPYSGGIYFNLWPLFMVRSISRRVAAQGRINLYYFHPWDLCKRSRKMVKALRAGWLDLHWGDTFKKFEKLLDSFPMGPIADNLEILGRRAEPYSLNSPSTVHEG